MATARSTLTAGAIAVLVGVALARKRSRSNPDGALFATRRRTRNAQAAQLAAGLGATAASNRARRVFASAARKEALDAELELRSAEQVVAALGQMKGVMMKLGQFVSFADETMPESVREVLAQLQQDAPPMSAELAASAVNSELGAPPEQVFAQWDPVPIAAASIGQVHRALTKDGRAVAVKVQYPAIDEAVKADLGNLDLVRPAISFLFKSSDPAAMVEEVRVRITEELDYEVEANNQRLFASWYRDHPFIAVPEVVDELSTRRVLTTDLAEGVRFAEMETLDQDERNLAAETIFRFIFRSLWRFHGCNGDPHPGNYLFLPGGRVTFLDFGMARTFDQDTIDALLAPPRARIESPHDAHAVRLAEERAGWIVKNAPISDDQVLAYDDVMWEPYANDAPFTFTPEYAVQFSRPWPLMPTTPPSYRLDKKSFDETLRWANVPGPFVMLQRVNLALVNILGRLNATANWRRISEELFPFTDDTPSTPMGEREAEWWASKVAAKVAG
jgi:predicted unusual protein kinase regulating ubiquinone biosynthesis (AarF/ABC1/UbiB family)